MLPLLPHLKSSFKTFWCNCNSNPSNDHLPNYLSSHWLCPFLTTVQTVHNWAEIVTLCKKRSEGYTRTWKGSGIDSDRLVSNGNISVASRRTEAECCSAAWGQGSIEKLCSLKYHMTTQRSNNGQWCHLTDGHFTILAQILVIYNSHLLNVASLQIIGLIGFISWPSALNSQLVSKVTCRNFERNQLLLFE